MLKASKNLVNVVRPTAVRLCSTSSSGGINNDGLKNKSNVRQFASQVAAEPFLNGSSSNYVEEMFFAWEKDPASVHKVFRVLKIIFIIIIIRSECVIGRNNATEAWERTIINI